NDQINEPVIVILSISKVAKKDLPGIDELFSRIKELKPGNSYSKETVDHMKLQEDLKEVLVLTASDSNTKGLSGVDTIDGGTYAIYAYNKGVHGKVENTQLEDTRGGLSCHSQSFIKTSLNYQLMPLLMQLIPNS